MPQPDRDRAEFAGVQFARPVTWVETSPLSQMRAANYTIPARSGSEAAELAVFIFPPGQGGDIENNIKRWQAMFKPLEETNALPEAKVESEAVAGMLLTLVTLEGDYRKQGAAWFTPDQLFYGAILETNDGGLLVFRLVGPQDTVSAAQADFLRMLRSAQPPKN